MSTLYYGDLASFNPELMFFTEIINLESLHYGYWDEKEHYDLDSLRKAQKRYTNKLMDLIPDHVNTILDVGCGIGDVASALIEKDYKVTAISPDENHSRYFDHPAMSEIKFINTRFEDLAIDDQFDLIQMIESHNYIEPEEGFSQCRKYLNPQGSVLVSGMFRKGNSDVYYESQILDVFLKKANSYGFQLVKSVDITENVIPTMYLAFRAWEGISQLFKVALDNQIGRSGQWKLRMLLLIFSREYKRISRIYTYYQNRLDPDLFREQVSYLRLVFMNNNL
jgi:2-polyprenyl-3-methyl-5-hydroxy-6-metoxy-1,4-benzoquinol methylase